MKSPIPIILLFIGSLIMLALAGIYTYSAILNHGETIERKKLLVKTTTSVSHINSKHIEEFLNSSLDVNSESFKSIVNALGRVRKTTPDCHEAYLVAINKDRQVYFIADADHVEGPVDPVPGEVYKEASKELVEIFTTKKPFIEGPSEDQWGVWVSGLTPILNPDSNKIIAVLGIDVDAKLWVHIINTYKLIAAALVGAWIIIFGLFWSIVFRMKYDNMRLTKEIESHKETIIKLEAAFDNIERLEEIIPICAVCKKVRDDKGYWQQVESYMKKHTDARFSHSLCPICLDNEKKKYPEYFDNEPTSTDK